MAPPARLLRTLLAKTERSFRRSSAASVFARRMQSKDLRCSVYCYCCRTSLRVGRTFVERIIGIRLEEQVLQADHDRVEVEDGLPIFAEDVEADIAFQVDVRVVDLRSQYNNADQSVDA